MGLLKRSIDKKAAAIDARRWALVNGLFHPGEQPRHNTSAKIIFSDDVEAGLLFLTNRTLFWATQDGRTIYTMPFTEVRFISPQGGTTFQLGLERADGSKNVVSFEMYPSPLSVDLYDEFIQRVEAVSPV
jgi:hypothetical protein